MRAIRHTPHHPGAAEAFQRGGVRQRRDVLPDLGRLIQIQLEFNSRPFLGCGCAIVRAARGAPGYP